MKRLACFVVLMLLSSSAHADGSFSFVVAGHRIRIGAASDCASPSCVSFSVGGAREMRRRRERNQDVVTASLPRPARPAVPPTQSTAAPPAPAPLASQIEPAARKQEAVSPAVEARADPPEPPQASRPPPAAPKQAAAPGPSPAEPVTAPAPRPAPVTSVPVTNETVAPAVATPAVKVLREVEEAADSPLGDWRPAGNKGLVRIETCGSALCGYLLDPKSGSTGESVLINMKLKAAGTWSGNIYSRDSGTTYYGTLALKDENSLRVEACAFSRFFCAGTIWSRVATGPRELITSSQKAGGPKS